MSYSFNSVRHIDMTKRILLVCLHFLYEILITIKRAYLIENHTDKMVSLCSFFRNNQGKRILQKKKEPTEQETADSVLLSLFMRTNGKRKILTLLSTS